VEIARDELQRRIEVVAGWYHDCRLCPRDCGVDRWAGQRGVCRLGVEARWYRELLHLGEERELVPSHCIYLAGCSFRCASCSDGGWVRDPQTEGTRPLDYADMARRVAARRAQGAKNVNLVGGTPDVSLYAVLRLLAECPPDTAVVWNSNLWLQPAALALLDGVVDVWLPDHKYGDDTCALRLSGLKDYRAVLERNLLQAARQRGRIIVRHLVLPGHLECCTKPVLAWLREHLPGAKPNVTLGYYPFDRLGRPGVAPSRQLASEEKAEVVTFYRALDFPAALLDGEEFR
jgi:putative pyruvate formate lyase activating enzyme